jgi:O-antigen ligase
MNASRWLPPLRLTPLEAGLGFFWLLHTNFLLPSLERQLGMEPGESGAFLWLYLVSAAVVLAHRPRYAFDAGAWLGRAWPVLLIPLLAVASSSWSGFPALSLKRGLMLCGSTLVVVRASYGLGFRRFLGVLGLVLVAMNLLSLLTIAALPDLGTYSLPNQPGVWRGLYNTKNELGRMAGFSLLVFVALARTEGPRRFWGFNAALAILAMAGARSMGALTIAGSLVVAMLGWQVLARRVSPGARRPILLLAMGGLGVAGAIGVSGMLAILGKDATLTGRTFIWMFSALSGLQHPILGAGYGAFWFQGNPTTFVFSRITGFATPHAHNGFLDLWLELGLTGLVAGGLFLAAIARVRSRQERPGAPDAARICHWVALWAVLTGLVESGLFTGFQWLTLVILLDYALTPPRIPARAEPFPQPPPLPEVFP